MSTEEAPFDPPPYARAAFAELARISIGEESMDSVIQRVAQLAKGVIPGVAESSVSVVINDKASSVAYTGKLALDLDESRYGRGYGPCLEAAVGRELREITDVREETRWRDYARVCAERGSLSSMSVPMPVQETVHAALNLYATEAHAFDDEARKLARGFAAYAAVGLANVHLYSSAREHAENLDRAMQSRAVIEQAKGILMAQRRCGAAEAFTILTSASQRSNRKLRDIAAVIVGGIAE